LLPPKEGISSATPPKTDKTESFQGFLVGITDNRPRLERNRRCGKTTQKFHNFICPWEYEKTWEIAKTFRYSKRQGEKENLYPDPYWLGQSERGTERHVIGKGSRQRDVAQIPEIRIWSFGSSKRKEKPTTRFRRKTSNQCPAHSNHRKKGLAKGYHRQEKPKFLVGCFHKILSEYSAKGETGAQIN
jgi:hypothetical protein